MKLLFVSITSKDRYDVNATTCATESITSSKHFFPILGATQTQHSPPTTRQQSEGLPSNIPYLPLIKFKNSKFLNLNYPLSSLLNVY